MFHLGLVLYCIACLHDITEMRNVLVVELHIVNRVTNRLARMLYSIGSLICIESTVIHQLNIVVKFKEYCLQLKIKKKFK